MSQKFVNAIPLYRQEKELERLSIEISRQKTMANWVIRCATDWLSPIYLRMKETLISSHVIHEDETLIQVLKEPNKKPQSNSYMWLYRTSGDTKNHVVLYRYQPDRIGQRPMDFLKGFNGYLHTDGYEEYHNISDDITVCGCWSHVRHKFDEALKSITPMEQIGSKALQGKTYCDKLFAIERFLMDCNVEEKYRNAKNFQMPMHYFYFPMFSY